MNEDTGKVLRDARGEKTLGEISILLGLSKSYISELETGKKDLSRNVIKKYIAAFPALTPNDFFPESRE